MTNFTMYLAPGWSRFDLREQAGPGSDGIDAALSRVVRGVPPSRQPAARALVEQQVRPMLEELAAAGAIAVLSALGPGNAVLPFVVCQPLDPPADVAPVDWLVGLVGADPTMQLREVPTLLAVRSEAEHDVTQRFLRAYGDSVGASDQDVAEAVEAGAKQGLALGSRRVTWIIGDPDDPARWLSFTLGLNEPPGEDGHALSDDAVAVFDAMMTTVRWAA